jgi:quercetin dioxygenase-like cupin family protein
MEGVVAADPDAINDFCVADLASGGLEFNGLPCRDAANVTGEDFAFRGFQKRSVMTNGLGLTAAFAGVSYPALNTMGMALVRFDVAPYALIPPHTHPRASEAFYVQEGSFYVGFVDTSNKLFAAHLHKGDVFLFPRGLVHFELCTSKSASIAIATLNSQNPGVQSIASSLFGSGISDGILAKSFATNKATVDKIQKLFTP